MHRRTVKWWRCCVCVRQKLGNSQQTTDTNMRTWLTKTREKKLHWRRFTKKPTNNQKCINKKEQDLEHGLFHDINEKWSWQWKWKRKRTWKWKRAKKKCWFVVQQIKKRTQFRLSIRTTLKNSIKRRLNTEIEQLFQSYVCSFDSTTNYRRRKNGIACIFIEDSLMRTKPWESTVRFPSLLFISFLVNCNYLRFYDASCIRCYAVKCIAIAHDSCFMHRIALHCISFAAFGY